MGEEVKSIQKSLIPIVAVAATAVLLLAGCQQRSRGKDKAPAVEQTQATVDTTEEDTMAAFYERMQRWKALHGWTNHWKSEK